MTENTFDTARMEALKEYSNLEYEICLLLKEVLRVEAAIAAAIFYQITNTRARYAIIEGALDINFQDTFAASWPKLEKWLGPRDAARNHIIHWGQDIHVMILPKDGPGGLAGILTGETDIEVVQSLHLSNPTKKWRLGAKSVLYTEGEITDERRKSSTMKHIINRLRNCIREPDKWPWTDKFQQPITDSTPEAFLSRLNDAGYPTLP
jgi:hypothetical protein